MSKGYPDQKLIDALYRELSGKPTPSPDGAAVGGGAVGNGGLIHKKNGAAAPSDQEVIDRCRGAKNAAKFAALFDDGDLSEYDGDASDADAGLLGIMSFYTKNRAQLTRLWGQSRLGEREKFNRDDYRERTLDLVLDGEDEEESDEPELVWFADLGEPEPRKYLIKDLCAEGYPLVAFGAGGVAKSFGMLQAGVAISGGHETWFGLEIMKHGTMIYIDFELDQKEQHRRVHDLCAGLGVPVPKRLGYISGLGRTVESTFKKAIKASVQFNAVAVIIDSMGLAMQGDMSDAKDILEFHRKYLDPFRKINVTPLIIDHEGKLQAGEKHKNKTPIGSAYKAWAARSVIQFAHDGYDKETTTLSLRIRHQKANFGPQLEPFGVDVVFEPGRIVTSHYELDDADLMEEDAVPGRDRIRAALEAGDATVVDLAKYCDLTEGTVRNILSRDLKGKVDSYQEGRSKKYFLLDRKEESEAKSEEKLAAEVSEDEGSLFEEAVG